MRVGTLLLVIGVVFAYECPKLNQLPDTCSCHETVHGLVVDCQDAPIPTIFQALKRKTVDIIRIVTCTEHSDGKKETTFSMFVRNMTIQRCDFDRIPPNLLEDVGTRLRYLNIERNNFTKFPHLGNLDILDTLEIGNNNLTKLTPTTFANLPRLKTLKMNNGSLTTFPTLAMKPLNGSLLILDISHNFFVDLSAITLPRFQLQKLDVSYNLLTSVKIPGFWQMTSLQELKLNNNKITEAVTLHSILTLKVLDLSGNQISRISHGFFNRATAVETLDVSSNTIVEIPNLTSLPNLTTINLDNNKVDSLGEGTFDANAKLSAISCRSNRISHISADTFTNANNSITVLFLNNNTITTIENGTFGMLHELTELGLSHNHQIEISNVSHPGLKKVFRLDIGSTNLKTLRKNDFDGMVKLEWLDVRNNSIERIEEGTFGERMGTILISVAQKRHSPTIPNIPLSPTSTTTALPPSTKQRP
uniref:LRRCT domain-containing protein n=1 Tax=Panagrellus redivivus TaxID=6233 RepID=A0A7E4W9Z6_PANRE